jgi:hypothetical protein
MRAGRLCAIVAASLLLVAAPAGAAPQGRLSVGPNVDVSRRSGNQAEQAVAVNPTNPNNIVIVSNLEFGTGMWESYSFDGGATWTRHLVAKGGNLGASCCDPTLSFDAYGNLFMGYLYQYVDNVVPIALSTDGGRSFRLIAELHAPPLPESTGPNRANVGAPDDEEEGRGRVTDQPTVTSGAGTVWVTYNASGGIQAAGAAVSGLGKVAHFTQPQEAPGSRDPLGEGSNYGDVAIGPTGQVAVTYQTPADGEQPSTIKVNVDPDGIGPAGFGPPVVVATDGAGGFDYIPAQSGRSVDAEAGMAYDRTDGGHRGRLHLLYTRETPDESNDTDVMTRYSDDGGHTWGPALRVNDDATTNSQFHPRIALDQATGFLMAGWHDARSDLGAGGPGDTNGIPNDDAQYWGSASFDGGATWVRNVRISAGTSNASYAQNGVDYGDYSGLACFGGSCYPAWADNSNSTGDNPGGTLHTLDVYTARVRLTR